MRKYLFVTLTALIASPVPASTHREDLAHGAGNPIDMLYPEIAVDDSGWRGLLPVILYNTDKLADQPKPAAAPDKRSERGARQSSSSLSRSDQEGNHP